MKSCLNEIPAWMIKNGIDGEIAISSRVRLARNLKGCNFPLSADREQKNNILGKMKNLIDTNPCFEGFIWLDLTDLSIVEREILVEQHILSPHMANEAGSGRAVTFNPDKTQSIMFNEEDHIRLQVILEGFDLKKCWMRANRIDDEIENEIDYAFSSQYGYKTCCPTNVGTAMRASVMLHLPAVVVTGGYESLVAYVSELGMVMRGIYGEGSKIEGNFFQVSNQITLGMAEEEILEKLSRIARMIIDRERSARERILFEDRINFEDRAHRDFALLKSARILSAEEFINLFSIVRMGVDMKVLPQVPGHIMNELMLKARPGCLKKMYPGISDEGISRMRAELSRDTLNSY